MHKGIKLRHIRAFLDVAEEGGITAAARRQGISQPALSKTLAELDALMGVGLLTRMGRRSVPTPAGETFRRHALQAIHALEAGVEAAQGGGRPGMVTVGALPTVAGSFFPTVALDFTRRRPGVRIAVVTGPHGYLLGRLRDGDIDLIIGRMPAPAEMPGLRFDYLYEEEIVLAARAGHPFAGGDPAQALRASDLILPSRAAIIRRPVDDYLVALGITDPAVRVETVSLATGLGLLEQSDMLWFISRGVIARELKAGKLVTLPISAQFMAGAVGLTLKQSDGERSEVAELVAILQRAAEKKGA
jgi:LysR family pca operon transcriptional activator